MLLYMLGTCVSVLFERTQHAAADDDDKVVRCTSLLLSIWVRQRIKVKVPSKCPSINCRLEKSKVKKYHEEPELLFWGEGPSEVITSSYFLLFVFNFDSMLLR